MYIKDKYPSTKDEFIQSLNKNADFNTLTVGSREKATWKCSKGTDHIWQASPNQRTSVGKLRGCPICAGKIVVPSTSLAKQYPEIAKEWNNKRNKPLTAEQITSGSSKKVWWRCKKDPSHEWQSTPKHRTRQGNSCPVCDSLGYRFPSISGEWHPIKNGELTPFDIPYSSHKKIWWKCEKGFDHIWEATPNLRTSMKTGCPICANYKVVKSNSLAAVYPEIALQWFYEKNKNLSPEKIYCKSSKKVWWKCNKGDDHEWQAIVKSRANGIGCPICSGRKTTTSNSLGTKNPEVAQLWHPYKNQELTPYQVTPFSGKTVWWKCPEGDEHEWQATVANLVNGSTCPVCMNRKITSENNLFSLFPELKEEWDFERNKEINPTKISAGSKLKAWWICKRDNEHTWFSAIKDRTQKESGCPICSIKLNVSETKMLELLKKIFKNIEIRYRYKPKWLKRMELDVFIPSLKLGFEYQGIQHFKPIDFFGGEETYIAQAERDKLKKQICDEEGINLIYVYHDESLSRELLESKIIDAGINLN